jgi:N-acetylmuramoyl-L-alanine amidase
VIRWVPFVGRSMFQRLGAFAFLAVSLNAAALPADEAYRAAQDGVRALKADPARRQYRHHWLNAARRFEQLAAKHGESPRAPKALLAAAQLLQELSQISGRSEDLNRAVADFEKLFDGYPKHPASDAAAVALGRIYLERKDAEAARRVVTAALARHPPPGRASELKALLGLLKKSQPTPAKATAARSQARPPAAQGRRGAAGPESRTRELLEAIARASVQLGEGLPGARGEAKAAVPSDGPHEATVAMLPPPRSPGRPSASGAAADWPRGGSEAGERSATDGPSPIDPLQRARSLDAGSRGPGASLAQQLGLKIHRVVLDPGHGGHDTGAIGRKGTKEKDVALAIALRLRDRLSREGLEVILTRSDDAFIALEERARIANEARGDLFISIHCNSAPTKRLRGIETYTLNTSSDRYSIRLAARENASSNRAVSDLQYILADLATKANTEESSRLAGRVQQSLVSQLRAKGRGVLDLGTKEALFYVLLGVRMPAILVETSFLSNPEEERLLSSKAYQADLAAAIASGIHDFLANRQRVAKVD